MDDSDDIEKPRKRRQGRGSLIERAGSVYDFEAVLRARVMMPDSGATPDEIIDAPRTSAVSDPFEHGAEATTSGVTAIAAPSLAPNQPMSLVAGNDPVPQP